MKQRVLMVALIVCIVAMAPAMCLAKQGIKDREILFDPKSLQEKLDAATVPIEERLKSSPLKSRFVEVKEILQQPEVDKVHLLDSLRGLRDELTSFTEDWETVSKPMWDAHEALAESIDRVRMIMARGSGGEASEKTTAMLRNYDERLRNLAEAVNAEEDPVRKKRLKKMFAAVRSLRKLAQHCGDESLSPAIKALHPRVLEILSSLQSEIMAATFELEEVRVVLASQAAFVSTYVETLEIVVNGEILLGELEDMRSAGTGLGAVMGNVESLREETETFVAMIDDTAGILVDAFEEQTAKFVERSASSGERENVDLDAEIRRYLPKENGGYSHTN